MRTIYFCTSPKSGQHAGGVKVIYDHSHSLNNLGIESFVLHERRGYQYPWVKRQPRTISDRELLPTDHLVIPEIKAARLVHKLVSSRLRYSIFVQNGYYLRNRDRDCSDADIDFAYQRASRILSISNDTSALIALHYPFLSDRITRVSCSIDTDEFHPRGEKQKLITYMPRKNGEHAEAVVFALRNRLPSDWQIQAIDGMSVAEVASALRVSRIFLSFSAMEGLGLPPVEAALCGNYVIGYHGGGGREYWSEPNFDAVEPGDIAAFVRKVCARAEAIDAKPALGDLLAVMDDLRSRFSEDNERANLQHFIASVTEDSPGGVVRADDAPLTIALQKRKKIGWWFK
jgi:hypothetical protein